MGDWKKAATALKVHTWRGHQNINFCHLFRKFKQIYLWIVHKDWVLHYGMFLFFSVNMFVQVQS